MAAAPSDCLDTWLKHQLGHGLVGRTPVGGGCIHQAWRFDLTSGGVVFAKTNAAACLPLLEAEMLGLGALARYAPPELVIPEPLACGLVGDQAVLVLGWLDLGGATAGGAVQQAWLRLGQGLAWLHRSSAANAPSQGYGWWADNFIGSARQPNGWRDDWATFFSEFRLAPQLAWAARRGEPLRGAQALMKCLPQWLASHSCQPVLVHGDLWRGNADLLADGRAAIFDPACYWGDREVDLAMARLFGGLPQPFFDGYASVWPLEPGAEDRVALYNLYHLINHANLFGGGYGSRAQACIDRLLD